MATKTPTKRSKDAPEPSKPPPKYVTNLLADMASASEEVTNLERQLKAAKSKRDTLVKRARDKDIPYNDIAAATGMSMSWINAALTRTNGYRPRQGRPRRLLGSAATGG